MFSFITLILIMIMQIYSSNTATLSSITLSTDFEDVMLYSKHIIGSVMNTVRQDNCSCIIITDGYNTSYNTIFTINELYAGWGMSVFEINIYDNNDNFTQSQFSKVINEARKVRRLSWCVMLLLLSDDTEFLMSFAKWSIKRRLLVWSTRVLLVTRLPRENLVELLSSHWSFSMMNTMALNINASSQSFRLLVHLPFSTDGSKVLDVGYWTENLTLKYSNQLTLFPEKYHNFRGAIINVASLTYEPYWRTTVIGNKTIYSGTDYNLLETLCQTLNFSFTVLPSKNWAEVEDHIIKRRSLLTPCIYTVLPSRLKLWDYTFVFDQSGFYFAAATPVITPNWLNFYYPLNGLVWIAVILSTIIVCILLVKITGSQMWRYHHGNLSSGSVILETVGSLLGQGLYGRISTSHSNHTLVGTWLLFGVIISTAYRSSLIASLTLPSLPPRPETIEQLVNNVNNVTMENYGKYYKTFFSKSDSATFRTLGQLMHLGGDIMEGLNGALNNKGQAHLGAELNLRLTVSQEYGRLDGSNPLYIGKESMLKLLFGWPIQHDAPYKQHIDKVMWYLIQGGLYEHWKKTRLDEAARKRRIDQRKKLLQLEKNGIVKTQTTDTKFRSLTITHFEGPLLLLLSGLSIAGVVFILEKILKYRMTHNT